jgi:hypothetical protein
VKYAFARPAGDWRRFVVLLSVAVAALVAAPGARAALPDLTSPVKAPAQLPLKDRAVGDALPDTVGVVVDEVVNEPLPQPVEDVVESTPVAPVRDEVRRVVNQTTGGGSGGGGGGGGGSTGEGSSTGGGTGGGSTGSGGGNAGAGNSTGNRRTGGPGRAGRGNRAGRGDGAGGGRGAQLRLELGAAPGRATDGSGSRAGAGERGRNARSSDPDGAPAAAIRTIRTVVEAVPTLIWIALGLLTLIALGLAARTWVERRNARALARDREQLLGDVAALERALLPAIPERLGSVTVSVAYRSCEGPAAGGDFYDAFDLPGGRAAVILGDISGHGPDALEGTNSVRAQLHALLETGMTPRAAIAAVGERSPVQLAGRFSTVVIAVHDPEAGTLTFATAGHAPPIVLGPGAEELLSAGASPPIGVGLRTGLRETTIALSAGSTCCFYTDGLVEAKNGDGMVGRGQLRQLVAGLGPEEQADILLQRLIDHASEASDDMTVVLLRPVVKAAPSPRVELLELDADDIESGFAARFLDACGVPAGDIPVVVEQAREAVSSAGLALVEVTIAAGVGSAHVTPAPEPTAPQAAA